MDNTRDSGTTSVDEILLWNNNGVSQTSKEFCVIFEINSDEAIQSH